MEEGGIGDFAQLLVDTHRVHEIVSPTDYRTKTSRGSRAYLVGEREEETFEGRLQEALGKMIFPCCMYLYKRSCPSVFPVFFFQTSMTLVIKGGKSTNRYNNNNNQPTITTNQSTSTTTTTPSLTRR